ncbi:HAD family hydrolase [Gammaproteobacteria bacterium]|nr:HAD family hydrolase [Gammaproteobacteria bacterium]
MVQPKLICFDWDGTLINTHDNIKNACIAAGSELGLPPVSLEKVEAMTGVQIDIFFNQVFGIDIDLDKILPIYHRHYNQQPLASLYSEAIALLSYVRQCNIAVALVTNKSRKSLESELKCFKIASMFDSIWVAEEHAPKPSPLMIRLAQATHQALPEESWMVGDALPDLYAAERAGCQKTILVSRIEVPAWMENVERISSLALVQSMLLQTDSL